MIVTISGPPGSGKTTVCGMLSKRLGMEAKVFGMVFRQLAAERGLSLAEMGALAEGDPSIDHGIDDMILDFARGRDDVIVESRLSAYMLTRNGIPAFRIYLDASPETRAMRIGLREGETLEEACRGTEARQASEAARYMKYYGIDISDRSVYDLVIDTSDIPPDEVISQILSSIGT